MRPSLLLLAGALSVAPLQSSASAGQSLLQKSHGDIGMTFKQYGPNNSDWGFLLSGTFHVGTARWTGVLRGGHGTGNEAEMGLWGDSADGVLNAWECVDGVQKTEGGQGAIVCIATLNDREPAPLVLRVKLNQSFDPSEEYNVKGVFNGP
jgi:hypothetical protein